MVQSFFGEPAMFKEIILIITYNMGHRRKEVNHKLNHIWSRVWPTWNHKPLWSRVIPACNQPFFIMVKVDQPVFVREGNPVLITCWLHFQVFSACFHLFFKRESKFPQNIAYSKPEYKWGNYFSEMLMKIELTNIREFSNFRDETVRD